MKNIFCDLNVLKTNVICIFQQSTVDTQLLHSHLDDITKIICLIKIYGFVLAGAVFTVLHPKHQNTIFTAIQLYKS